MSRLALRALVLLALGAAACSEQVQSTEGSPSTSVAPTLTPSSSTNTATTVVPAPSTDATSTSSSTTSSTSTTSTSTTTTTSTTTLPPRPTTTSCEQVVHIGDSTSVQLFDPKGVGGAELTMEQRYRDAGVSTVYPDNDGARAIIEHLDGDNALEVAQGVRDNGYHGCWVLMVGTNDAANIAAGANTSAEDRIRRMMDTIGGDPVLWVNAVTQRTEDAYRNASMLAWNDELERVAAAYPNMKIFDWYDVVQPQWFRNDGIHYTVEGSAQRAALTAQALVDAFPAAQAP
jgi:hypothetical protein